MHVELIITARISLFSSALSCGLLTRWPLIVCMCRVYVYLHVPQVMQAHRVRNLVFSSSATVYGDPQRLPIDEQHPVGGCTNPYGKTKYFIEEMVKDHCKAEKVNSEERHSQTHTLPSPELSHYSFSVGRTGMLCCCAISIQSELIAPVR